jgi:uncharacterized membrane protein
MNLQDWVAVIGVAIVLIGFFVKLPSMIDAQIAKNLTNYNTKLEAHEAYVRRHEYEKREAEINRELRFMRRIVIAIAQKVGVNVDAIRDLDGDD